VFIFNHPWLLLLLLLPLLFRRIVPAYRPTRHAIRVPWFNRISSLLQQQPETGAAIAKQKPLDRILFWLCWSLIVIALAQPLYLEEPLSRSVPTRDLMLLVDLSGSMETEDFTNTEGETVDRLTAVKGVLDDFLTRREGDRVSLVVFGNAAFVQVPFTQDLEACRLLLEETAVRMAGPRTAFGDAIGLGITLFQRSEMENRVMIALTDGNDTGSKVPPVEAAKIARDNEITVHVVGVGDPAASGEEKLDEDVLNSVASTTGGQYFHAADREDLERIYAELDKIGTRDVETQSYRPQTSLFHWPLAALMLVSLAYYGGMLLKHGVRQRRAAHG
jgi:Ca-activated chloride channel family protein